MGTQVLSRVDGASFDSVKVPKDKLDKRQIFWNDGSIGKAIIIDQNFKPEISLHQIGFS